MHHHYACGKLQIADVCNVQPYHNDVCRHSDIGEVAQQALWKGPCIPGVQGHHKPAHPRSQTEEDKLRGWQYFQLLQSKLLYSMAKCNVQASQRWLQALVPVGQYQLQAQQFHCSENIALKVKDTNVLHSTAGCCMSRCVQSIVIYVSHNVLTSHLCILLYIKVLLQSGQRRLVNISPKLLLRPQSESSSDRLLPICHDTRW